MAAVTAENMGCVDHSDDGHPSRTRSTPSPEAIEKSGDDSLVVDIPEDVEKGAETGEGGSGPTARQWGWYVWIRLRSQLFSVSIISGYLVVFYLAMLHRLPPGSVFGGLAAVCIGITFFMEGFMSGIMPLAELLGQGIPDKFSFCGAMATTFLLGIACTLAEPAMGALELAGSMISHKQAPVLWYLLTKWNFYVFLSVGLGVGFAALVGTARLLRRWNLKLIIYTSCAATLALTVVVELIGLSEIVGMAWDCGAVTTGAVTVPIILGLGVGILTTDRKNRGSNEEASPLDSFGIVTLASLYPIMCVLLLGMFCKAVVSEEQIERHAAAVAKSKTENEVDLLERSPFAEIIYGTRAVVPLIVIVIGLIKLVMKENLPYVTLNIKDVKYSSPGQASEEKCTQGKVRLHCMVGILEAYAGLVTFNIGLKYGQGPLGDQVGAAVPAFYSDVDGVPASPVVADRTLGISFVILFTFFMAFLATYAEPALNAMGLTIEELSKGSFKKALLLFAVALGVGSGVALGVLRMVFDWSLTPIIVVGYAIAIGLTVTSSIEFVSVAWDSAGVTTSSITVPLVLSMGLGLGEELGVQDVFGLLATGSVGPIVSVLIAGHVVAFRERLRKKAESGCT